MNEQHDPFAATTPPRAACLFKIHFAEDGLWCEQRWKGNVEYYCGPCGRYLNSI